MRRSPHRSLIAVALVLLTAFLMPTSTAAQSVTNDIWTFSDEFVDQAATVNGCGSQGAGFDFVPDNLGFADFGTGCDWHDKCYSTEGMPRDYCDMGMFAKHLEECDNVAAAACVTSAVIYFVGVRVGGEEPYQEGQAEARYRRQGPRKVATSRGDPHLVTFDGRRYSFMAVGDFDLVTNGSESLVQTRFHPLDQAVSMTTGVAVQLGADRIVAVIDPTTGNVTVTINGTVFTGTITERPDGIITMTRRSTVGRGVITVRGHDGFRVEMTDFGLYFDVSVHLSDALENRVGGLLGDVATYTDTQLVVADTDADFVSRFRLDAQRSWFPASADFDYFGDEARTYPRAKRTLNDFPSDAVSSAQQACTAAGVAAADVDTCALDVVVTGDAGFARRTGVSTAIAAGTRIPAPVIADSDRPTAEEFTFAIIDGDLDVVKRMLAAGADPNSTETGLHPMLAALSTGDMAADLLQLLLDAGADVHGGVARTDDSGSTPLSAAALNQRPDLVTLLVAAGARWEWGPLRDIDVRQWVTDPATLAALGVR